MSDSRSGGGFVTADAPTRTELAACVQCGLCLPHCPTFRLTGKESASPRGRLAAMSAVLEGEAQVDEEFDEVMSFCLGCRACEAVCPSMVPYGRALEGARAELAALRPSPARRARRALLGRRLLGSRAVMRAATVGIAAVGRLGLRPVVPTALRRGLAGIRPVRPTIPSWIGRTADPTGEPIGTAALLAGCVMEPWFGKVHEATVGLLRMAGYRVVVPAGQTCCGALAAHDGQSAEARRMAAANLAAFAGADLVVADAAGCSAHLKEYGHWVEGGVDLGARARDVTEVVAAAIDEGRLRALPLNGPAVAVQDPCHLRHAQRIIHPPRAIVAAAGYTPVEIDPDGLCCGAAGIYSLLYPEAAAELGRRKAAQVRATAAPIVVSANPGCEMQLRAALGDEVRVVHPVELYWEALSAASPR
jgi:glycolate oxidase iron-sulfur subunit